MRALKPRHARLRYRPGLASPGRHKVVMGWRGAMAAARCTGLGQAWRQRTGSAARHVNAPRAPPCGVEQWVIALAPMNEVDRIGLPCNGCARKRRRSMALVKVLAHSTNPVTDCDVGEQRRRVGDRAAVVVADSSSSSSIALARAQCRARRRRVCRCY